MISQRHAVQKPYRLLAASNDTSTETQSLKRPSREERKAEKNVSFMGSFSCVLYYTVLIT
jgi:hypothetical protein